MKVLANGGLNLSSLDGWWAEAFRPDCGWALGDGLEHPEGEWDRRDADQLYTLLEDEVVPAFYDRGATGLPQAWIARMRASMATLAPAFSSVRMLQEYIAQAYLPAAASFRRRTAEGGRVAREIRQWAAHLRQHWSGIRFGDLTAHRSGGQLSVSVAVHLGAIAAAAIRVELYADGQGDQAPVVLQMTTVDQVDRGAASAAVYHATCETTRPDADFTPRVVPFHPEAQVPMELSLIAWQR
jgi:glycogen phosphorylase